ncbi:MAG TPA: hypothetical protein VGJ81_14225 [Thermoanaerobaculia bacterium]|jgi:hypothetical protein
MADVERHHTYSGDVVNVETHHEESDVNVRALIWFMVAFIVFAAVMHVGVYLLYRFYRNMERGAAANAPMSAVAMPQDADVPPTPHLQPFPTRMPNNEVVPPTRNTPVTDMADMRQSENERLATYGWVDKQHGIAHIPINEAKKLALQSGVYQVNPGNQATQQPGNPATPQPQP